MRECVCVWVGVLGLLLRVPQLLPCGVVCPLSSVVEPVVRRQVCIVGVKGVDAVSRRLLLRVSPDLVERHTHVEERVVSHPSLGKQAHGECGVRMRVGDRAQRVARALTGSVRYTVGSIR